MWRTALQEQMEKLAHTALAGGERNDAVDHCLAGIARLSHEVKDASSYIPAYDQRTYGEVLPQSLSKLQTSTDFSPTIRPSKRFLKSSRRRAQPSHPAASSASKPRKRTPPPSPSPMPPNSQLRTVCVFLATFLTHLAQTRPS